MGAPQPTESIQDLLKKISGVNSQNKYRYSTTELPYLAQPERNPNAYDKIAPHSMQQPRRNGMADYSSANKMNRSIRPDGERSG